jgi:hypothetical protein
MKTLFSRNESVNSYENTYQEMLAKEAVETQQFLLEEARYRENFDNRVKDLAIFLTENKYAAEEIKAALFLTKK